MNQWAQDRCPMLILHADTLGLFDIALLGH
jgi:hypothetical protein